MIVMSIAGVDPSGGAGLFADIKTFQSLGVYGTGIVTALTCQNPYEMFEMEGISPNFIEEEIDSVFSSYNIEYIKTGMLYSAEIIKLVSRKIKEYDLKAIVDPVMVASSGRALHESDIAQAFNKYLLPNSFLTTPNVLEASTLSGIEITNEKSATEAALKIGEKTNVIITGGHLNGINTLFIDNEIKTIYQDLIKTENLHGSGCTFSAAIVSYLALSNTLEIAIKKSLKFTYDSVKNGNHGTLIQK